jgi:hypothetical protein
MKNIAAAKNSFMAIYADKGSDMLLVRYEDLVERQDEVMGPIAAFLELPASRNGTKSDALGMFKKHGTSSSPEDSVGRWKRDLARDEAKRFSEEFSDFFETFGYEQ